MNVTGFTFIRNAVTYNYPVAEAIRSILPLCREMIVAVGRSDDATRELVAAISPKVRIIDTEWDDRLREGGRVLAAETNKAYAAIPEDSDWCLYIQGDEVLHEDGYPALQAAMERWKDDPRVEGLLLRYRHFFGSYQHIGSEGQWYRKEIRVLRKRPDIYSYKDAQGFRKGDNEKLNVKPVEAWMHHYGWVQDPRIIRAKFRVKDIINHGAEGPIDTPEEVAKIVVPDDYVYGLVRSLALYKGTHPAVMEERIRAADWTFQWDMARNRLRFKDRVKNLVEKLTGRRPFDYRNYRII